MEYLKDEISIKDSYLFPSNFFTWTYFKKNDVEALN
jgi:hypothetical protein